MDDLARIESCGECQRDMWHVVFSFERGYGDTGVQQVEIPVEEFIIGCILGRDSDNFLFVGYECIAVGVGNEKPPFIGYSYSGCFIFLLRFSVFSAVERRASRRVSPGSPGFRRIAIKRPSPRVRWGMKR